METLDAKESELGSRSVRVGERTGLHFHFDRSSGAATLTVNPRSLRDLVELAQQIVWLSASFWLSKYGQVSYPEALLGQTGTNRFEIKLVDLEAIHYRPHIC